MRGWRGMWAASAALPLAGCLPMMAANVANTAARVAIGPEQSNSAMGGTALDQCKLRAQSYGAVHVIDIEQRRVSELIVWGTVDTTDGRKSFKCVFTTKLKSFTLRSIPAAQAG